VFNDLRQEVNVGFLDIGGIVFDHHFLICLFIKIFFFMEINGKRPQKLFMLDALSFVIVHTIRFLDSSFI
jgi:hypothetical protein